MPHMSKSLRLIFHLRDRHDQAFLHNARSLPTPSGETTPLADRFCRNPVDVRERFPSSVGDFRHLPGLSSDHSHSILELSAVWPSITRGIANAHLAYMPTAG